MLRQTTVGRKKKEKKKSVASDRGMGGVGGIRYSESGGREKPMEARMGLAKGRKERRESQ